MRMRMGFLFFRSHFLFSNGISRCKSPLVQIWFRADGETIEEKVLLRESGGLGNLPYEHFVSHSFSPSLSLTHPHTRIYCKEDISLSLFLHTNSNPCTVHRTHTLLCTRTIGIQHPITHSHKKNTLSTFHLSLSLSLLHPFARSLSLSRKHTHSLSHTFSLSGGYFERPVAKIDPKRLRESSGVESVIPSEPSGEWGRQKNYKYYKVNFHSDNF